MADWIFCATASGVDEAKAQSLLRSHQAIHTLPPGIFTPWPGDPEPGDRLWLLWRARCTADPTTLLGGGRVWGAPQDPYGLGLLWANSDCPGMKEEAERLGFKTAPVMFFIRLQSIVFPPDGVLLNPGGLGSLAVGLNEATSAQVQIVNDLLSIP